MIMLRSVHVGGRTYQVRFEGRGKRDDAELIDVSNGSTVLRVTGRHYGAQRNTTVHLSPQHRYTFPIIGVGLADEVMTAVDEAGNNVIRYRQAKQRRGRRHQTRSAAMVEAVVNPAYDVTPDILLLIAMSSGFLLTDYRMRSG
jgi:hypothetical protein